MYDQNFAKKRRFSLSVTLFFLKKRQFLVNANAVAQAEIDDSPRVTEGALNVSFTTHDIEASRRVSEGAQDVSIITHDIGDSRPISEWTLDVLLNALLCTRSSVRKEFR
jgi:hypothetical protein